MRHTGMPFGRGQPDTDQREWGQRPPRYPVRARPRAVLRDLL